MAVKLHRCSNMWVKVGGHPCWKIEKALQEMGIEYEALGGPVRRGKRDTMAEHTGQRLYPAIEFEDGSVYKAESKEMADRIREGRLFQGLEPAASGVDTAGSQ
jgi:hypothetical protein